ncbi:MAG TPA: chemotaxis protein CheW [Polyangiaceae bacterium]|nr:chemotaxis protein CheW [Polyangiaceae bacterium]
MKVALEDNAWRLRQAFDDSFAAPAVAPGEELLDFLLVQVTTRRFAVRLSEIAGVTRSQAIVRLPTGRKELLGLSCIRGAIRSVYSMAAMLGLSETQPPMPWLALSERPDPVAVAFDALDGFVRVPRSLVLEAARSDDRDRLTRGVINLDTMTRPIVDMQRLLDTIRKPAGHRGPPRSDS